MTLEAAQIRSHEKAFASAGSLENISSKAARRTKMLVPRPGSFQSFASLSGFNSRRAPPSNMRTTSRRRSSRSFADWRLGRSRCTCFGVVVELRGDPVALSGQRCFASIAAAKSEIVVRLPADGSFNRIADGRLQTGGSSKDMRDDGAG